MISLSIGDEFMAKETYTFKESYTRNEYHGETVTADSKTYEGFSYEKEEYLTYYVQGLYNNASDLTDKMGVLGYELEDLYQVAVIGIIKASKNYQYDYNTKFMMILLYFF